MWSLTDYLWQMEAAVNQLSTNRTNYQVFNSRLFQRGQSQIILLSWILSLTFIMNMIKFRPSVFKFKRIAHSARLRQILLPFIAANLWQMKEAVNQLSTNRTNYQVCNSQLFQRGSTSVIIWSRILSLTFIMNMIKCKPFFLSIAHSTKKGYWSPI